MIKGSYEVSYEVLIFLAKGLTVVLEEVWGVDFLCAACDDCSASGGVAMLVFTDGNSVKM